MILKHSKYSQQAEVKKNIATMVRSIACMGETQTSEFLSKTLRYSKSNIIINIALASV